MTFKDFQHIQNYFASEEDRDPSIDRDPCSWIPTGQITAVIQHSRQNLQMFRSAMVITESRWKQLINSISLTTVRFFKGREDKFCLPDGSCTDGNEKIKT